MLRKIDRVNVSFYHIRKDGNLNASITDCSFPPTFGEEVLAMSIEAWAICEVVDVRAIDADGAHGRGSLVLKIIKFFDGED